MNHDKSQPEPQANILKTVSSEWQTTRNNNEVTCHSRMIEGVLCRWWGEDTPPGVQMIDAAASTEPARSAEEVRRPGKYRLVYNKTTRKIDKVRNYDGLAVESFDPPIECDDLSRKEKA